MLILNLNICKLIIFIFIAHISSIFVVTFLRSRITRFSDNSTLFLVAFDVTIRYLFRWHYHSKFITCDEPEISMQEFGFQHKLVNLIQMCIHGLRCKVRVEKQYWETFEINNGPKETDGLEFEEFFREVVYHKKIIITLQ